MILALWAVAWISGATTAFATTAFATTAFASTAFASIDDDAQIDLDIAKMGKAMRTQDYSTLVDLMYAPLVQAVGRDQLIAQVAALGSEAEIVSYETVKPYRRISGSVNDYVIIPTHSIVEAEGIHFATDAFQLAIRPHGSSAPWQYLSGRGISEELRSRFFSDLPADTVFPAHKTSMLDGPKPGPFTLPSTVSQTDDVLSQSSISLTRAKGELPVRLLCEILVGSSVCFVLALLLTIRLWSASKVTPPPNPRRFPAARVPPMR